MELNDRKKKILKSIVDTYILSGEPVGSKYLSDSIGLNVSPATIRNEMSELERLGLLEQPHTSAGRVPSSHGFRVYVENLMNDYYLSIEEISVLNEIMNSKIKRLNTVIEDITRVLSEMTDYTAFAYTEKSTAITVKRFEGVLLTKNSFLLVMVTSSDNVKTQQVKSEYTINSEILGQLLKVLNENLAGVTADSISMEVFYKMQDILGVYADILMGIIKNVIAVIREEEECKVYLDGMSNLLKYPDFSDIEKTRTVLSLLEEKQELLSLISKNSGDREGLNVLIGDKNLREGLDQTSFVYHKFNIGDNMTGVFGLIGPHRMDYSGVIARLEYVVKNLIGENPPKDSDD